MDNDTKHVLTILGLVACFGAGYFVCRGENKDAIRTGEKFSAFTRIENNIGGKTNLSFENENKAVESAVNGYYKSVDNYFEYNFIDNTPAEYVVKNADTKEYDYIDKYQIIDNIAYINCSHFDFYATQGFVHFFRDNPEADGFIIDLRNNGGGVTDNCMSMLGYFIEPRNIVRYYRNDGTTEDIGITDAVKSTDKKVIILVNGYTASSAEIFTSAMMQFYEDTTIIGTKTYGKGIFQQKEYISENETIEYTAGYYTVGNWDCYNGIGITPDIEIPMDYNPDIICTDEDIQLQTALDLFK